VQFGTADDIDDLLAAARGEFADLDVVCAVAAFGAALTEYLAIAYSLPSADVHEQFFGVADAAGSAVARACRKAPRVAVNVRVPSVAAARSSCMVASASVSSSVA
jgi:hypothetical protein